MTKILNFNKEHILYFIALFGVIFLIFYWSHLFVESKIESMQNDISSMEEKIEESGRLLSLINSGTNNKSSVNTGLLSFVQNLGKNENVENKIISVKPKSTSNYNEAVSLKIEKVNLNELTSIVSSLDKYSNIIITSISIDKRYDDPKFANMSIEIGKQ